MSPFSTVLAGGLGSCLLAAPLKRLPIFPSGIASSPSRRLENVDGGKRQRPAGTTPSGREGTDDTRNVIGGRITGAVTLSWHGRAASRLFGKHLLNVLGPLVGTAAFPLAVGGDLVSLVGTLQITGNCLPLALVAMRMSGGRSLIGLELL